MPRIIHALTVLALICIVPAVASAQQLPDWTLDVRLGRPLYLTLLTGERVEGVAGSVTAEGVAVATPVGVRTARFADIRRVERRDGPWNGIWIGTAVGAALGVAAMASTDGCQEYGGYGSMTCSDEAGFLVVGGALYGGLIGWGVDTLLKGRSTLFDDAGATRVSLAAGPHGVSGRLTIGW